MAKFEPWKVTAIRKTIPDAVELTLAPPGDAPPPWLPGQHLTFRRVFGGVELRRNYSICTAPRDGVVKIGIKRVEGGVFSTWANEELQVGEVLEALPPQGRFTLKTDPDSAKNYLAFAGGSGITPILSMLRAVLAEEPRSRFTLVYANRGLGSIMFREEIEDLKDAHLDRLALVHVLETDAQEIDLFTGRLDAAKCAALFRGWVNVEAADTALICGPEPMMRAVRDALKAGGMAPERIRYELFRADQPGRAPRPAPRRGGKAAKVVAEVIVDGASRSFEVPEGMSLLEAALANEIDAPHACKAGVCASCKARLLEGEVDMIANHALEDYEVEAGQVLTCQCYPLSERIVISYDG